MLILIAAGIALAIMVWARLARKSEISGVYRTVDEINKIDESRAVEKVVHLIEKKVLTAVDSSPDRVGASVAFGPATKRFLSSYTRVSGEEFSFFAPEMIEIVGGDELFLIGEADSGQSKYLLKRGEDRVLIKDIEDRNLDSKISFPSVWHAIVFESR